MSDLALANVEALYSGEGSYGTCLSIRLCHPSYNCIVYIHYPLEIVNFTCYGYKS
ncbi:MAG: NVEALA domain-containing protein [Tannerellaceae bacterium]|nr:NVEALA domain-containing protein [Tannerellaceae bacterium]